MKIITMVGGGSQKKENAKGRPEDGYLRRRVNKNGTAEILSKFNPNPNPNPDPKGGDDLPAIARFENSNFENNTLKWYSHGSINSTGGGMTVIAFSDFLKDNSTLFNNAAKNNTALIVKLFACNTGQIESPGGLAYDLSKLHPNMIFMAPTTYLSMGANYMGHIKDDQGNLGYFNVFQNGRIIERRRLIKN